MRDSDKTGDEGRRTAQPFAIWERLRGESAGAYAAFCAYRDLGAERDVRRAVETAGNGAGFWAKSYKVCLAWAAVFHWRERAAEYDRYGG